MIKKYKRKESVVEATQYTEYKNKDSYDLCKDLITGKKIQSNSIISPWTKDIACLLTDWIIKEPDGTIHVCKNEIFSKLYTEVDEENKILDS